MSRLARMILWWLVIIDMPDERDPKLIRRVPRPGHIHSRFKYEEDAQALKERLESFGGRHEIVDLATTGGRCPRCGEELLYGQEGAPEGA